MDRPRAKLSAANAFKDAIEVIEDKEFLADSSKLETILKQLNTLVKPIRKIEVFAKQMVKTVNSRIQLLDAQAQAPIQTANVNNVGASPVG
eukprot:CAMPEP_0116916202 /NCGR_PEP_ID=MMETSP0467-20121206/18387_1 /TAXON_ID=283647 /ORGANISM="Mesodinium pulex, Strain SPMC105" /LENGTH=90 /DNA_ID=CAMNT_0004593019 /DNA_START=138 /DNA_END=410 /DNA_ORIENTATION=-